MSINNRAQVPGYCGYIPGKYSENKFGATFAHVTKDSYPTQTNSFLTTNIANNTFIQQQHTNDHTFWGNDGKVSTFDPHTKKPEQRIKRTPIESTKMITENISQRHRHRQHMTRQSIKKNDSLSYKNKKIYEILLKLTQKVEKE